MGLCRDIDNPHERARCIKTGRKLWTCDAPSCTVARVPWGETWQWLGSWKEWENDPFSVSAVCSEACKKEHQAAMAPKVLEVRNQ